MNLQTIRAKPNPSGKDRFGGLTPNIQLVAEWIDIANMSVLAQSLAGLVLYHNTYDNFCRRLSVQKILLFKGVLQRGEIIRIHSGREISLNQMRYEDIAGVDYHLFTGMNYIWNNKCGDSPQLYNSSSRSWMDLTYYDPNPPEGKILRRIGNKLI